ncbi:DUF397 domain-containing protein [Embleya sp. AB8]|uniref:DUF397 domain-containing protein n=1 Tax=Embleya sp. AB8 TaxID=3156304 RepID=UPI003C73BBCF
MARTIAWRKSSHSGDQGDCIEVADGFLGIVPVRDSKDPSAGYLVIGSAAWTVLIGALRG